MTPADIMLPLVATSALGFALLVPLRDPGPGRRASLGRGAGPLRVAFETTAGPDSPASALVVAEQLVPTPAPEAPQPRSIDLPSDVTVAVAAIQEPSPPESADQPGPAGIVVPTPTSWFGRFFGRVRSVEPVAGVADAVDVVRYRSFAGDVGALLEMTRTPERSFGVPAAPATEPGPAAARPGRSDQLEPSEPGMGIASSDDDLVADSTTAREFAAAAFAAAVDDAAPKRSKRWFRWRSLQLPSAPWPIEPSTASRDTVTDATELVGTPRAVRESDVGEETSATVVRDVAAETVVRHAPAAVSRGGEATETVGSLADVAAPPGDSAHMPEAPDVRAGITDPIVVPAPMRYVDRIVPITRLPLRRHPSDIAWWTAIHEAGDEPPTRTERHALLSRAVDGTLALHPSTVERAYFEEDRDGRLLALRVLVARNPANHRAAFVDALHVGTDSERELAVDGLAAGGAVDALPVAFRDRVEAVAARAALAYVGPGDREAYRTALAPHVDEGRIVKLLALLAGVIE